jgi:hypothetical protein
LGAEIGPSPGIERHAVRKSAAGFVEHYGFRNAWRARKPGIVQQRIIRPASDPFARRRLAARVRPFVLRRTKREVRTGSSTRIEEDMLCELEGTPATLYRAELKRARAALLRSQTQAQLDSSSDSTY